MANKVTVLIDVVTRGAQQSIKSFRQSIADADGAVGKMKAGASSAFSAIGANIGAFAVTAGAALVTFGAKAVGAFQDLALEAGKASDATGIAIEDMSRLIEVAGDLGIEAGTIEGAIQKMNKSLADGKAPTDELTDAIVRGADGNIDSYESFISLATAIGKIKDPTKRAQAAQETFGRSYGEIAELMSLSADELRQKLGEVSDAKIIDRAELEKARELREAMDKLRDASEDVSLLLGETLVPILSDVADGVSVVSDALSNVGLGKGGFLDDVISAQSGLLGLVGNLFGSDEAAKETGYSFGIMGEKARRAAAQTDELEDELADAEEQADRTAEAFQRLKDELALEEQVDAVAQAFDDLTTTALQSAAGVADGSLTMEQAQRNNAAAVRKVQEEVIALAEEFGQLPPSKVVEINALMDQGAYQEAERLIELLVRRREFPISPRVVPGGTIPKFATGTNSAPAGLALVGEQGPELVAFGGGERVIPAGRTQQMLQSGGSSGGGAVFNVTVNTGVGDPVEIGRQVQQVLDAYYRAGGR